jgi:hypothetical protein
MKLYHGTKSSIAHPAFEHGLAPRGMTGSKGNWPQCPSSDHLVYMTSTYAGYFANVAVGNSADDWAIVEVETDLLDPHFMMPDEDFLEQASRRQKVPGLRARTMEGRTRWFHNHIKDFSDMWEKSVKHLGNASYMGVIPPEAITRVSSFDPKSNRYVAWAFSDPQISLLNHYFMSKKYQALTRWFFDEPSEDDVQAISGNVIGSQNIVTEGASEDLLRHAETMSKNAREMLAQRSGLLISSRT